MGHQLTSRIKKGRHQETRCRPNTQQPNQGVKGTMHKRRYTFRDFAAFMKRDSTIICLVVVFTVVSQTGVGWLW